MRLPHRQPLLTLAVMTYLLAACGAPPADLPPLPEVATERVLPAVREQMEGARLALADAPTDAQKNGDYAMVLHAYDRSEAALTLYERARRLAPKDPRWPYYQSAVLARLGRQQEALEALDAALALSPDHIDVLAKRGEALYLLGQLDEAESVLSDVVTRNPKYPLAQFYLARLHIERQEWQQATDKFEDLLARGLNVRDLHQNLGVAYRMLERMDDAARHLDIASRSDVRGIQSFDPINMVIGKLNMGDQPHLLKARELYSVRNLEAARRELAEAIEKNPDSLGAHLHMIRIAAEQKDMPTARRHFDKVMELEPENATAHASWGLALGQAGRLDDALASYRRALELDSGNTPYRVAVANVLGRLGRYDELLAEIGPVLAATPDDRSALFLRGTAELGLRQYGEALDTMQQLRLPEDHNTPMILRGIAVAQHGLGHADMALTQMDAAIKLARSQRNTQLLGFLEQERARLGGQTDGL